MKMKISQFNNGDKVQWNSAAGVLTGTVQCIRISKNALEKMIPWLQIENIVDGEGSRVGDLVLPGNSLAMYQVKKI
jgi:hypothetical protein